MASPFIESLRAEMRLRGYSLRTEKTYLHWVKRFIYYIGMRHPSSAGAEEVRAFLTYLANDLHHWLLILRRWRSMLWSLCITRLLGKT